MSAGNGRSLAHRAVGACYIALATLSDHVLNGSSTECQATLRELRGMVRQHKAKVRRLARKGGAR